jgi:hypothetical protein
MKSDHIEEQLNKELGRIANLKKDMPIECWMTSQLRINMFKVEAMFQQHQETKKIFIEEFEDILDDLKYKLEVATTCKGANLQEIDKQIHILGIAKQQLRDFIQIAKVKK